MEELPFRLILGLLIASVVVVVGIQAVNTYLSLHVKKEFADDVIEIKKTMDMLVSVGDKGSFVNVHIKVPKGCDIKFAGNKMQVKFFDETKEYDIPGTMVQNRDYGPGSYDLVVYYGSPQDPDDQYKVAFE